MTLPRTMANVLSGHVTFEVECIDRMYLNVWEPRLAYGGGVAGFFTGHRGNAYASTALMDPMSKAFVADIHHFIAAHDLELVHFAKRQRKDEVTQRLLASFTAAEGVLYVGRAQEKSNVWRTQRIGDRPLEAQRAGALGAAYLQVSGLRDLDQAETWFKYSLSLRPTTSSSAVPSASARSARSPWSGSMKPTRQASPGRDW